MLFLTEHRVYNLDLRGSGCDCVSRLFFSPKKTSAGCKCPFLFAAFLSTAAVALK